MEGADILTTRALEHHHGLKCAHCPLVYNVARCKFLNVVNVEIWIEFDMLVCCWYISNIHNLLPWHLSSYSLRKKGRVHVATRFIFLFLKESRIL